MDGSVSIAWHAQAGCRGCDIELFFPEAGRSAAPAKRICRACGVRGQCLEYALARNERSGVWGGLTPRERRLLMRERKLSRIA